MRPEGTAACLQSVRAGGEQIETSLSVQEPLRECSVWGGQMETPHTLGRIPSALCVLSPSVSPCLPIRIGPCTVTYAHACQPCRIAYMSASPVVMATNKDTTSPAAPAAAHVIILSPTRGAFIRAACAQHTGLYPLRAGIC